MSLTDAQLDNIRRGDTSQIDALVEKVRRLQDTDALVEGLYKSEANLADARAEVERLKQENEALRKEHEAVRLSRTFLLRKGLVGFKNIVDAHRAAEAVLEEEAHD